MYSWNEGLVCQQFRDHLEEAITGINAVGGGDDHDD
jgi:hypothetical protein